MKFVTIRHAETGHTSTVPASSVAQHVRAGWVLVEDPEPAPKKPKTKKTTSPAEDLLSAPIFESET